MYVQVYEIKFSYNIFAYDLVGWTLVTIFLTTSHGVIHHKFHAIRLQLLHHNIEDEKNTILIFILFGIHRTFLRVGFTPLTAIALELLPMMRATTNFTPMLSSSECKCNKNTYYLHMLPVVNEQTNKRSFRGVGRSVSRSSTSA